MDEHRRLCRCGHPSSSSRDVGDVADASAVKPSGHRRHPRLHAHVATRGLSSAAVFKGGWRQERRRLLFFGGSLPRSVSRSSSSTRDARVIGCQVAVLPLSSPVRLLAMRPSPVKLTSTMAARRCSRAGSPFGFRNSSFSFRSARSYSTNRCL